MATAKQRAWRTKFARLYGGKRKRTKRSIPSSHRRSYRYRSVNSMAKRHYRRRSGKRSGFGGLGSIKNMLKLAGGGVLAGIVISKFAPQVPYAPALGGFLVGGIPGAISAFAVPMVLNAVGGSTSSGNMNW